jgi:uncharacterized membrane protein
MKLVIAPIIFIGGIISICSFIIPATFYAYGNPYQTYTNIFTNYVIDYAKLFTYIFIWTLLCIALHFILKNIKFKKSY